MIKHLFLQGKPGVGKTTILEKFINQSRLKFQGFITKEVRDKQLQQRIGFNVVDIESGISVPLASKNQLNQHKHIVGKYVVHVEQFEKLFEISLNNIHTEVIIIDEIGKMELYSALFQKKVQQLLNAISIIGTIPSYHLSFLNEYVLSRNDVKIIQVTRKNQQEVMETLHTFLEQILH